MIRPKKTLIEVADEYSDTHELADALLEMADDDALSQTTIYYLKECATHMEALYSSYLETVRALHVIKYKKG